ncbi:MAG: PH domain-containing protein [Patescibacteria group bacterium]|mgnify:CR=1 FL=1
MRELNKILDQDERVLWEGVPSFWPFVLGVSVFTFIFGLFWMAVLTPFIIGAFKDIFYGSHFYGFGIFLLPHFWAGIFFLIGMPIYLVLVYKHTYYAITDKRVIFQKGWIGRDFQIVDFDQITNAEVNVGVFDKIFEKGNTGSIHVSTAGSFTQTNQGGYQRYTISHVKNPYDVFKFFKKVYHDVKTDIHYPNKLRPEENPGYQTKYNPDKN